MKQGSAADSKFVDNAMNKPENFRCLQLSELLQKANDLPLCPGVYLMRDRSGKIIYVGKSRKLKNRVSQYFQNSEKNVKTAKMVSHVANFDYFLCDTEMEALTLENHLIKQYTPKYNIRLKDAKSYPYIKVTEEMYPRLIMTRQRGTQAGEIDDHKGKYFGPYSGVATVYSIIDTLKKTLCLPACKHQFPRDIGKVRPCLYRQMGRCCGVCTGEVTTQEYGELIKMATDILSGHFDTVRQQTQEQMLLASDEERYEAAARYRDTIRALDALADRQKVVADPDTEQDVVALYSDDVCSCVSVFYIRRGALTDKSDFVFGRESLASPEDMSAFLLEHYRMRTFIPKEILLSFPMEEEEQNALTDALFALAGHRVVIRTPERGKMRTLCRMVMENAEDKAKHYREEAEQDEGALIRLAELCHLEVFPERIEAYDISNLGKEHLTAGMIVCQNGKFKRSDYRTFHIKTVEGTDDYASMRETIARRIAHLSDGTQLSGSDASFSQMPDLILLDGGRTHVAVVKKLLAELGCDIQVFGMVKDDYHKTRALCTENAEINIAKEQQVFLLLYRIQEEVHRFTVSRMDAAKRKTLKTSSLEKIKGIGSAKAKILLNAFGTLAAVKNASYEELAALKGISSADADAVWTFFHENVHDGKNLKK